MTPEVAGAEQGHNELVSVLTSAAQEKHLVLGRFVLLVEQWQEGNSVGQLARDDNGKFYAVKCVVLVVCCFASAASLSHLSIFMRDNQCIK